MKNIPQLKFSRNNSVVSTEASASQVQTKRNSDKGPHESMRISMLPVAAAVAAALFALSPMPAHADFVTALSPTVFGDEDTSIPLGAIADQAFFTGGSAPDVIGTTTAFVDAADASKLVNVTIPAGTQSVRITGIGGNDNGNASQFEEEFLFVRSVVNLSNMTYSGSINAIDTDAGVDDSLYVFSEVPLGNASDSGVITGNQAPPTNITISAAGNTLSLEGNQTTWDQAYFVEFLSAESTSANFLGSNNEFLIPGLSSAILPLPATTSFASVSISQIISSNNFRDEDKGVSNLHVDVDAGTASGVIAVNGGRGARESAYAFTDYDLTSGLPILDPASGAVVVGDADTLASHLSNPTLTLSGTVLTITRAATLGSNANTLISVASFERAQAASAAESLGSSSDFAALTADLSGSEADRTLVMTLPIPVGSETANLSFSQQLLPRSEVNENTGYGQLTVDLVGETVSGSLATIRLPVTDLVALDALPFGVTVESEIGASVTASQTNAIDFADEYIAALQFDVIGTAPNQSLQISATVPVFSTAYDHLWSADWFGVQPILFEGAGSGTFSAGGEDITTGLWVVDPADLASLTYTPDPDLSGGPIDATIFHGEDVDPLEIFVRRVADVPTLSVADQTAPQNVATNISSAITAALSDTDGSETLAIHVTLEAGHTITDGGANSFTAAAGNDTVDVTGWDLANLDYEFTTPGVYPVSVRAESTDSDNFTDDVVDTTDLTAEVIEVFDVTILLDTDADGIPDTLDTDDDNDGIPDTLEGTGDTDGDGIPDSLDLDSDGDGIPDADEVGSDPLNPLDTDGDGTPDHLDTDADGDGIPDADEIGADPLNPLDTDGDGVPDFLDLDADGDGIPDADEIGADPSNPLDTDGDGTPDHLDLDSDGDGIADSLEGTGDADGNGIPDFQEAGSDSDGDGIPDSVEGTVDSDGDGIADFLDEDSDNDGIPDSVETGADADGDGVPDYLDVDADNDGISDAFESAVDTDGDGIEDFRDLDVDNDGIFDLIEARIGLEVVNQIDADNDGIVDLSNAYGSNGMADIVETTPDSGEENYELPDVDGDGVLDWRDLDSDNDGLLDTEESDHTDDNLNGIVDTVSAVRRTILVVDDSGLATDAGGLPRNTDADGLADFRDLDSDNDGIMDVVESFGSGLDADNDGMLDDFVDADGDGIDDNFQAAPLAPADTDGDGIADANEIDADGDGIPDLIESGGVDADGDGMLDGFVDADGDGVDDTVAVVPTQPTDSDGDGIPDFQELDADNDGVSDLEESGGIDADGDGFADSLVGSSTLIDTDGDGILDFQDAPDGVDPVAPEQGAATGLIRTGLDGSGCAISPTLLTNGEGPKRVDPMLPMLSVLALMGLAIRRRATVVKKKAGKAASVAAVAIGSLFLGGCASFGGDSGLWSNDDSGFSDDEFTRDYEDKFSLGLYAVAGIGPSRLEPDTSEVPGRDPNDRVEPAGQLTVGADLTKHLSVEAHTADLGSAGLSAPGAGEEGRINYHIKGVSALLYAGGNRHRFRRQGLTAFGRLGYGSLDNTAVGDVPFEQINSNHFLIGAGLEYMTPIGVGVRLEGVSFDEDVQYGQLGLMYRTGRKQKIVKPKLAQAPARVKEPVVAALAPPPPPPPVYVPAPAPVVNQCAGLTGVLEGVYFHSDSAELTSDSMNILDDVAFKLGTCEDMQIEISAHTDSVGAESYNQGLSERRAQSVVEFLSASGLSRGRLKPTAYGESSPIDSNDTRVGRARNRRVELYAR